MEQVQQFYQAISKAVSIVKAHFWLILDILLPSVTAVSLDMLC